MYSKRSRRKTTVKKSTVAYVLPLALSVALVILVIVIINMFVQFQSAKDTLQKSLPIASVHVETDNVSLLLEKRKTSLERGYKISLGNGEGLETGENARVFLPLMNKDYARLNMYSTVYAKYATTGRLLLGLQKGDLWFVSGEDHEGIQSEIKTKYLHTVVQSPAVFGISTNATKDVLFVVRGSMQASVIDDKGQKVTDMLIKEGQKIEVDAGTLESLQRDTNISILQTTDTSTTSSEWYEYNLVEDAKMATYEGENTDTSTSLENSLVEVLTPAAGAKVGGSTVAVSGIYEDGVSQITVNDIIATLDEEENTWSVRQVPLRSEGNIPLQISYVDNNGEEKTFTHTIAKVSGELPVPVLTSPTSSEVSDATVPMRGTVDESVVRVVVNDYELKKFVPGSGTWLYYLSALDGNLRPGKNTYTVIGYDEVGNASEPLEVEVTYTPRENTTTSSTPVRNTNTNTSTTTSTGRTNVNTNTTTRSSTNTNQTNTTASGSTLN